MTRILERLEDRTSALAQWAQPIVVAMSGAGLTGGVMAAAGMVAGRMMRRA